MIRIPKEELNNRVSNLVREQTDKIKAKEAATAKVEVEKEKIKLELQMTRIQLMNIESMLSTYTCPITSDIIESPAIAEDGQMYEEEAIKRWFTMNRESPLTRQRIENKLILDYRAKSTIHDLKNQKINLQHRIQQITEYYIP